MRFVIWIGTEHPWQEVAETARVADATGWDGIYLADHFMPNEQPTPLGPRLEAWTALGALAALTTNARLGVLVSGNTYRHPAILANMAATTDRISGGRLVLGLGAGWQENEHEAYGIDLYEVPERLARLEEACQVVRCSSPRSAPTSRATTTASRTPPASQSPSKHASPSCSGLPASGWGCASPPATPTSGTAGGLPRLSPTRSRSSTPTARRSPATRLAGALHPGDLLYISDDQAHIERTAR